MQKRRVWQARGSFFHLWGFSMRLATTGENGIPIGLTDHRLHAEFASWFFGAWIGRSAIGCNQWMIVTLVRVVFGRRRWLGGDYAGAAWLICLRLLPESRTI